MRQNWPKQKHWKTESDFRLNNLKFYFHDHFNYQNISQTVAGKAGPGLERHAFPPCLNRLLRL